MLLEHAEGRRRVGLELRPVLDITGLLHGAVVIRQLSPLVGVALWGGWGG